MENLEDQFGGAEMIGQETWDKVKEEHKEAKKAMEEEERKAMTREDSETDREAKRVIERIKKEKASQPWQRKKPRRSSN